MRRKLIFGCAVLVVCAAAIAGYRAWRDSQMTDLMRANLEALTNGESYADVRVECDEGVCIIFGYKNRFLAPGCKKKDDFSCTVQKIELPDISL